MSMNISVNNLDAAVSTLGGIKGDVTASQLSELTSLFSSQIWNTSDTAGTTQTMERQMRELEALIEEIEAKIEDLYDQQKSENDKMTDLLNNMNEESYQATKQADKNYKEQQSAISKATDEAYTKYMKGEIEKDEIPMYIATALKKTNSTGGAALEASLSKMDHWGQSITSLSNKISNILDSVNEYTAQLKTTQASLDLLAQLKAKIPEHKERADIKQTTARPYFSPSQEALGDKVIDKYKQQASGGDQFSLENKAIGAMQEGLQGSGVVVNDARKAELDAMTPEAKAAAVEDADFSKYTVPELFYLSGMDATQAAYALGNVFRGAKVGYNGETGALIVPQGHAAAANVFRALESQFTTLWGDGKLESGSMNDKGDKGTADPIGWREGDTNFMFAVDRDQDGQFDGVNEFLGYENGWEEVTALDTDNDGVLTAKEMAAGGVSVVEADQSLKGGGAYGFNGVAESGVESIDLNSYKAMTDNVKATNLNGNTRLGSFTINVDGENVAGFQTAINTETDYAEQFYGHMENEAFSFGLDPNDVAKVLQEAAEPKDYTATERAMAEQTVQDANDVIASNANALNNAVDNEKNLANSAATTGSELGDNNKEGNEETATNTNDATTATTTTTSSSDTIIPPDEITPKV